MNFHSRDIYTWIVVIFGVISFVNGQHDGCASYEFACNDRRCIRKERWCDGYQDCHSKEDEAYCVLRGNETHPITCPSGMMACKRQGCVPLKARCDGVISCKWDDLDERDCPQPRLPRVKKTREDIPADVENFDRDYEDDNADYSDSEEKALDWVLQRRQDYAFGDETERAIVALSFSKGEKFGSDKDYMLMIKTLHLRISLALSRNLHKTSLTGRALFIYALTATCGDPQNFYGYNLVQDLRGSVDQFQHKQHVFAAPIVYLTLCLTNFSSSNDIEIMKIEAYRLTADSKNDLKALFLLTTVCMEKRKAYKEYSDILDRIKRYFVKNLLKSDVENIYELALVTQALNAAKVNPETWDRDEKMKSILEHQDEDGSFRDMLATYYVMPLLSGKTLLSVGGHCKQATKKDSVSMESLRSTNERMNVNYTLVFGPQNITQSMFLFVLNNCSVYDVMRLAAKRNTNFRFSLDDKKKSAPLVYSIGGVPNDAEKGLFWNGEVSRWQRPFQVENIKTYNLQNGDTIIFSMKNYQY